MADTDYSRNLRYGIGMVKGRGAKKMHIIRTREENLRGEGWVTREECLCRRELQNRAHHWGVSEVTNFVPFSEESAKQVTCKTCAGIMIASGIEFLLQKKYFIEWYDADPVKAQEHIDFQAKKLEIWKKTGRYD